MTCNLRTKPCRPVCWDAPLIESRFKTLLINKDTPVEKARLLALASHQASTWLTAIPISSLGLKLDNNTLRVAICLRLGTKICEPHTCICGQLVDPLGRHGLSCRLACITHSRHKRVNDILRRSIASSGTPAMVEPRGLMDDDKRPDGLTLYPWSGGKSVCWDFTCRDSLCQSHVSGTSKEAGNAAKQAESLKLRHYEELTQNFTVIPVATETMGSWGPMGLKFVKEIGSRIAAMTGEKRSTHYLFQAISMAIQRGNVASILGTAPPQKQMDEIFYL